MTVKELAEMLWGFEDKGLGEAGICIESEDGRLEGAGGVEVSRAGALAVVVLKREEERWF